MTEDVDAVSEDNNQSGDLDELLPGPFADADLSSSNEDVKSPPRCLRVRRDEAMEAAGRHPWIESGSNSRVRSEP